jgi:hypothetical protein
MRTLLNVTNFFYKKTQLTQADFLDKMLDELADQSGRFSKRISKRIG